MSTDAPPPFPRIAHLPGSGQTSDDETIDDVSSWLRTPVVVEEKLDGANVAVWRPSAGRFEVAGRGGVDARDRAGQLGRLRAWVEARRDALDALLGPGEVLYGEWLWIEHSLRYDALPDWLIVLDLWTASTGFLDHARRDARVRAVGLTPPPVVYVGPLASLTDLDRLCGASAFTAARMEGLVLRREHDGRLIDRAKWVRPDFVRKPDAAWRRPYPHNALAGST